MTAYILTAVVAAVVAGGLGYWTANRRGRADLAITRAAYGDMLHEANGAADRAWTERGHIATQLDACEVLLDKMTEDRDRCRDAHDRGAEEFERLLEAYRAVPEAFRAPLDRLEQRADIRTPITLLGDEWPMPHMGPDAKAAADLAAILGESTDVWKRVVYRPAPATVDKTVHEGVVLPPRRALAMAGPTYPAPKQRSGKRGKR